LHFSCFQVEPIDLEIENYIANENAVNGPIIQLLITFLKLNCFFCDEIYFSEIKKRLENSKNSIGQKIFHRFVKEK
jgi:hypothetical protein